MSTLVDALYLFLILDQTTTYTSLGIHGNLTPLNIVVSQAKYYSNKAENGYKSSWKYSFKFRDLGMIGFGRKQMIQAKKKDRSNFDAPELAEPDMYGPNLTTKADVWSLGRIFSEILVWSHFGDSGRLLFTTLCMGVGGYRHIVTPKPSLS